MNFYHFAKFARILNKGSVFSGFGRGKTPDWSKVNARLVEDKPEFGQKCFCLLFLVSE